MEHVANKAAICPANRRPGRSRTGASRPPGLMMEQSGHPIHLIARQTDFADRDRRRKVLL